MDFHTNFSALTESAPWPSAMLVGATHTIGFVNPAFCRLLNKSADELVGQEFRNAIPFSAPWTAVIERVLNGGEPESCTVPDFTGPQPFRTATMWPVAIGTKPLGVMLQLLPSTQSNGQLLAVNEALVIRSVEQQILTETAEGALQEATEVAQSKDQLLAMLSHELRTPLTPVLMALSVLTRRKDLPPPVSEALQMIERNVRLEGELIDELLDFTRIGHGKMSLSLEPIDLREAVSHAVEIVAPEITGKEQHLSVTLEAAAERILGDRTRLRQVFWNLLRNASKFTPEQGEIRVAARLEGPISEGRRRVIVEVSDTGIGFAPESAQRLFEAFSQASEAVTQKFGGLGLGLTIARAIVEAHGGILRADSPGLGRGATFTVDLPVP